MVTRIDNIYAVLGLGLALLSFVVSGPGLFMLHICKVGCILRSLNSQPLVLFTNRSLRHQ